RDHPEQQQQCRDDAKCHRPSPSRQLSMAHPALQYGEAFARSAMLRPPPISLEERQARLDALRRNAEAAGCSAVLLGSTTSLRYFTGIAWSPSERFMGALVHVAGGVDYIGPGFEREKIAGLITVPGELYTWEEEQSPYRVIAARAPKGRVGV